MTCLTCRGEMPRGRRKYCCKDCYTIAHNARPGDRHKPAENRQHFVGIDGEGVTDPDGDHRYVLLTIGDESITATDTGGRLWGMRLQWGEVFRHIYDFQSRNPDAVMVGFYLGYDFAQWFRTLPEEYARQLLTKKGMAERKRKTGSSPIPLSVKLNDPDGVQWECDHLPGRRFKVRPTGSKVWAYVMDCGAFWQSSLLAAINPAKWPRPVCTQEEYDQIVAGKARRATAQLDQEMLRYNVLENSILARIMEELDTAFKSLGIHLKRTQWFGPGQAAQAWLSSQGVITRETFLEVTPADVVTAAARTFYGGWFYQPLKGVVPRLWEYDINSAYPFVASRVPCLEHGEWTSGEGIPSARTEADFTILELTAESDDEVIGCGLPWRAKDGGISTPSRVRGWYWMHEVKAAFAAGGGRSRYSVHRWWSYRPCDCRSPMHDIARLYYKRYEVGKNSPEGKAIKLLLNSIYGKCAQSVGDPKFANPVYASLITSGCRTMILNAIATHPQKTGALAMVATDGVYFTEPHPGLQRSPTELGMWDETEKNNTCLFLPGMYWDDKARDALRNNESVAFKSRGVNSAFLAPHIETIDGQFAAMARGETDEWPYLKVPIPFAMTTPVQALQRNKWEQAGVIQTDGDRKVSSHPGAKHRPGHSVVGGVITVKVVEGTGETSAPYDPLGMEVKGRDEPVDMNGQSMASLMGEWVTENG